MPSEDLVQVLVEAVGLRGYRVAEDGSAAQLGFVDASGAEVAVTIPQEGIGSLILTLPMIMDQLVRRSHPDPTSRLVFPTADWRLEFGSDRQSLILTLETPDRFRVAFALGAEASRTMSQSLASGADQLKSGVPAVPPIVLQ